MPQEAPAFIIVKWRQTNVIDIMGNGRSGIVDGAIGWAWEGTMSAADLPTQLPRQLLSGFQHAIKMAIVST